MIVRGTEAARDAVRGVAALGRTDLVFVLSSGCCDGTAPYLFDRYLPEPGSEHVGSVEDVPVLAPPWLLRLYPGDDPFVIDAVPGAAEDSLSLETMLDRRFVLRAGD